MVQQITFIGRSGTRFAIEIQQEGTHFLLTGEAKDHGARFHGYIPIADWGELRSHLDHLLRT